MALPSRGLGSAEAGAGDGCAMRGPATTPCHLGVAEQWLQRKCDELELEPTGEPSSACFLAYLLHCIIFAYTTRPRLGQRSMVDAAAEKGMTCGPGARARALARWFGVHVVGFACLCVC